LYVGTETPREPQLPPFDDAPPDRPVRLQLFTLAPLAFTEKVTVALRPLVETLMFETVGRPGGAAAVVVVVVDDVVDFVPEAVVVVEDGVDVVAPEEELFVVVGVVFDERFTGVLEPAVLVLGVTLTSNTTLTAPSAAVTVVDPGAMPMMTPWDTLAIVGLADVQFAPARIAVPAG
jgi:hypothetical protein